jgi:hypothetical protein
MDILRERQSLVESALTYAGHRWRVVVLHGFQPQGAKLTCSCLKAGDCSSPGKHPRLTNWQNQATCDPAVIADWWGRWPSSNVGVRLGPSSGICDVEADSPQGEVLANRLLSDIVTPSFRSGRSTHRLFQFPTGLALPKATVTIDGIELRFGLESKSSQSVFPPSYHYTGIRYAWLPERSPDECELATFPECLIELMQSQSPSNGNGHASDPMSFVMGGDIDDLATAAGVAEGQRHRQLCILVGGYLARHGITPELPGLAMAWGRRCTPPMPESEIIKTLTRLVDREQAKRFASGNGKAAAEAGSQAAQPSQAAKPTLITRRYSTIEARTVDWLWQSRFGLGKLTLLVGQAGQGKTFLACDMLARVSRGGRWPDRSVCLAGDAAILTAEDSAEDTLKPRLVAAAADPNRVHHIDGWRAADGKECFLSLADHLALVDEWLKQTQLRLLVVDPITAYLGNVDSHRNSEVRSILGPLSALAEKHHLAVVGITHSTKREDRAINRVIGSVAFVAASRAAWMVAADPDDSDRRLLLQIKNNLANASGLAYRIVDGRLEWDDSPVLVSADDISGEDATPRDEAREWLRSKLDGQPVPADQILKMARADGISERTLRRVKLDLQIVSERQGVHWIWRLPHNPASGDDVAIF